MTRRCSFRPTSSTARGRVASPLAPHLHPHPSLQAWREVPMENRFGIEGIAVHVPALVGLLLYPGAR